MNKQCNHSNSLEPCQVIKDPIQSAVRGQPHQLSLHGCIVWSLYQASDLLPAQCKMLDDEKNSLRDFLLDQIPSILKSFLQSSQEVDHNAPIRIVGHTPTVILDSADYLASIQPFVEKVQDAVSKYRRAAETCFPAAEIHSKHTFFVVDINNHNYDYENTQRVATIIPVYILRLSKRPTISRNPGWDEYLARRLANIRRGHQNEPLPLLEDLTKHDEHHFPGGLQS